MRRLGKTPGIRQLPGSARPAEYKIAVLPQVLGGRRHGTPRQQNLRIGFPAPRPRPLDLPRPASRGPATDRSRPAAPGCGPFQGVRPAPPVGDGDRHLGENQPVVHILVRHIVVEIPRRLCLPSADVCRAPCASGTSVPRHSSPGEQVLGPVVQRLLDRHIERRGRLSGWPNSAAATSKARQSTPPICCASSIFETFSPFRPSAGRKRSPAAATRRAAGRSSSPARP